MNVKVTLSLDEYLALVDENKKLQKDIEGVITATNYKAIWQIPIEAYFKALFAGVPSELRTPKFMDKAVRIIADPDTNEPKFKITILCEYAPINPPRR